MKLKLTLTFILIIFLFAGCGKKDAGTDNNPTPTSAGQATPTQAGETTPTQTATPTAQATPDAVSSASIVDTSDAFVKAISKTGTWIIATTKDLTIDKDLLLEGEFKNGKKDDAGKDVIQRKIALYEQDENRNITKKFTLTAPKLTITSPMASIQHGTFIGDLYVSVSDFKLVDAIVDGNVYFTTNEAKSTFSMDETSKITGKQEMAK